MRQAHNLVGRKFQGLTVLGRAQGAARNGDSLWQVECLCGNQVTRSANKLLSGRIHSCGCRRKVEGAGGQAQSTNQPQPVLQTEDTGGLTS